jgi:hypothetical protein
VPAILGLILAGRWLGEDAPEPKADPMAQIPASTPQKELV